jgi:hypothetical protein
MTPITASQTQRQTPRPMARDSGAVQQEAGALPSSMALETVLFQLSVAQQLPGRHHSAEAESRLHVDAMCASFRVRTGQIPRLSPNGRNRRVRSLPGAPAKVSSLCFADRAQRARTSGAVPVEMSDRLAEALVLQI